MRELSTDNTLNLIFGILASIIGVLSLLVAWTTWRLMRRRPTLDLAEGKLTHICDTVFIWLTIGHCSAKPRASRY
jgi:hypothetical protein